ncbi:hypothetical protein M427DRAFT_29423 [Gonapodya prolifera JEL478]|uniref:Thioredoxin-like fold domain-containing protein n=1 Tax=Gonapodya prolifera (strain JEL478) TaxID=1344416 RepID=A0A139AQG2_GONPJ|nr:hypothetical protein M427DRAFT_29423 [Gonapodya prolifera JEL478]|eukprot:KXS18990.1 hypothetical protein M427DRAFT_29423 [Gonapodya prolifera JEL478]
MSVEAKSPVFSGHVLGNPSAANTIKFILRQQVQPWHPQSALTHEAAIAVEKVDPTKFHAFSKLLFERQVEFFDLNIQNLSREQIYERLLELVKAVGVDADKVAALLNLKSGDGVSFNTGNGVTDDLKRVIRLGRQNGIHVSPTALFNGIVEGGVSSSWGPEEFVKFFVERLP